MRGVGWILDVHIGGSDANIWIKLDEGKAIHLTDNYRPSFYVKLKDGLDPHDVAETISLHPYVSEAVIEEKYASILSREKSRVIHVFAKDAVSFRSVRGDLEKLEVVETWFNIDLYHFQRYLFSKAFAPTNKVEAEWDERGRLVDATVVDDSGEIRPPPFSSLLFEVNIASDKLTPDVRHDPVKRIALRLEDGIEALDGSEAEILTGF